MPDKPKYGATVRVPHDLHERVSLASKECGASVGAFVADALEDVLKGYEAKSAILPRCIAKAQAHGSDPVVKKSSLPRSTSKKKLPSATKQPVRKIII